MLEYLFLINKVAGLGSATLLKKNTWEFYKIYKKKFWWLIFILFPLYIEDNNIEYPLDLDELYRIYQDQVKKDNTMAATLTMVSYLMLLNL